VCICARVRECDLRSAVRMGACDEDAVGDACGAGTGCGTCLDRIGQILDEESISDTRAVRVG
jgi:bacterioferritin-associated ferredoxin